MSDMASQDVAPPRQAEEIVIRDRSKWRAVRVRQDIFTKDDGNKLPARVKDSPNSIILPANEPGISVYTEMRGDRLLHLVFFERHGIGFQREFMISPSLAARRNFEHKKKLTFGQSGPCPRGTSRARCSLSHLQGEAGFTSPTFPRHPPSSRASPLPQLLRQFRPQLFPGLCFSSILDRTALS